MGLHHPEKAVFQDNENFKASGTQTDSEETQIYMTVPDVEQRLLACDASQQLWIT